MKIKWLGQSAFIIESGQTLVTDPYNEMIGKLPDNLKADVVTVTHAHRDHNFTEGVGGSPKIINQAGNFTARDFDIKGIATFHDDLVGQKRGKNIVYIIKAEGLSICHLGDLGHILTEEQLKKIGKVDILMIPVGGYFTIEPDEAVKVVNQIKPKIVLPMHYKRKGSSLNLPLKGFENFTQLLNWKVEEVDELEVTWDILDSTNQKIIIFK